jgi:hypothetical protein
MNWIEYKYDRTTIFGGRETMTDYGSDTLATVRKALRLFNRDDFAEFTIPQFRSYNSVTLSWYQRYHHTQNVLLELRDKGKEHIVEYDIVYFPKFKQEVYKLYGKRTGQRIKERG